MRKPTFHIQVVGCKVNQAEADIFGRQLAERGWIPVAEGDAPDLVLIHTCTVTQRADRDSRRLIQKTHSVHPGAKIIASGCLAELEAKTLSSLPGVAAVLGQADRYRLAELAAQSLRKNPRASAPEGTAGRGEDLQDCIVEGGSPGLQSGGSLHWQGGSSATTDVREPGFFPGPISWRRSQNRSRAWLKIQDGCAGACTYCRVHLARGKPVSRPMDDIKAEAQACLAQGFQELVLTGVNVGSWQPGLEKLLPELAVLPGAFRLRLSSLEPQYLSSRLIRTWGELGSRLCPHLHLALQSADNGVLQAMGRAYTGESLGQQLDSLRATRPDLILTADVIAGFPGETARAFERTCGFLREQGFSRLHVFPFSMRPGTPAADMAGRLQSREITARARVLRSLSRELTLAHHRRMQGKPATLLLETELRAGVWQGTTETFDRGSMNVAGKAGQLMAGTVHSIANGILHLIP
ncbi:MAG: radical SAM protein [candidate division FCPU426 bacterium]